MRSVTPRPPPPSLASHVDSERGVLTVRDEGPGVAPEELSRLTTRFYRADPSRQRGVGLYLSRAIAEAHGGSLEIESKPGQGTQIRVSIPIPAHS